MPSFVKLSPLSPEVTNPIRSEATWVASDKQTAGALAAVAAALPAVAASGGVAAQPAAQRHLSHITLSFSAVTTAAAELQVWDGDGTAAGDQQLWGVQIGIGVLIVELNFETRPIHGSPGKKMTIALSATPGAGIVGEVYACGYNTTQGQDSTMTEH
jgi:hypothetical protein